LWPYASVRPHPALCRYRFLSVKRDHEHAGAEQPKLTSIFCGREVIAVTASIPTKVLLNIGNGSSAYESFASFNPQSKPENTAWSAQPSRFLLGGNQQINRLICDAKTKNLFFLCSLFWL
jgi:hypothetical protein